MEGNLEQLAMVIAAFFVGLAILVPVVAISARVALKPVMESWAKLRATQSGGEEKILQDRRIALLEAEVHGLQQLVQEKLEARDFEHALKDPSSPEKR